MYTYVYVKYMHIGIGSPYKVGHIQERLEIYRLPWWCSG